MSASAAKLSTAFDETHTLETNYASIGPTYPAESTGRRLALARWITSPNNPLAARVAVNHVWAHHFGRPIVASTSDFGLNGSAPPHPKLLDALASRFVASGLGPQGPSPRDRPERCVSPRRLRDGRRSERGRRPRERSPLADERSEDGGRSRSRQHAVRFGSVGIGDRRPRPRPRTRDDLRTAEPLPASLAGEARGLPPGVRLAEHRRVLPEDRDRDAAASARAGQQHARSVLRATVGVEALGIADRRRCVRHGGLRGGAESAAQRGRTLGLRAVPEREQDAVQRKGRPSRRSTPVPMHPCRRHPIRRCGRGRGSFMCCSTTPIS